MNIKIIDNIININSDIIYIINNYLKKINKFCDKCVKEYNYTIYKCNQCSLYLCTNCHIENLMY